MLQGLCDMHSHILPGIDDGARNMEDTISAITAAWNQGIQSIIVTPHYHPGRYVAQADVVLQTLSEVQQECRKRNIQMKLYPGQECFYHSELIQELKEGRALTLAGSSYVLVEFSPDCMYSELVQGLYNLRCNGYTPILAHFERYGCLAEGERLDALKDRDYLFQMNFDTLLEKGFLWRESIWQRLAKDGVVDFFGSDCHGTSFRPYRVDESSRWLEKKMDADLLDEILFSNIQKILGENREL